MKRRALIEILLFVLIFISATIASEDRDILIIETNSSENYANPAHQGEGCATCHSALAYADDSNLPLPDPSAGCQRCHAAGEPAAPQKSIWHTAKNTDCVRCHSFHESNMIYAAGDEFEFSKQSKVQKMACPTCHNSSTGLENVADYHVEARHLFHSEIPANATSISEICLNCHGGQPTLSTADYITKAISVTHSVSHPVGIKPVLGEGDYTNRIRFQLDPNVTLYDGRIECQTCHQLDHSQTAFSSPFEPAYDLCLGCHEHNG